MNKLDPISSNSSQFFTQIQPKTLSDKPPIHAEPKTPIKYSSLALRIHLLELALFYKLVDPITLSLCYFEKKSINIPKKHLESLLETEIAGYDMDVRTFIKEGYAQIKGGTALRSYLRGSTVYSFLDIYEFLYDIFSTRIDLNHPASSELKNHFESLSAYTKKKPRDLDLLDIGPCDPSVIKTALETYLCSKAKKPAHGFLIPTQKPLYPSPDPYLLTKIESPSIKIDRVSGTAKTYFLFFDLFISLKPVIEKDESSDHFQLMSLYDQSPQKAIFDYTFKIFRLTYEHLNDFRSILTLLSLLAEGGFLIETIYQSRTTPIYCTIESALFQHLSCARKQPEALEIMLAIIKERTEKHTVDLLSYYLNILIFFKQVAQEEESTLERIWTNAKNHLLKNLREENQYNLSLTSEILRLLQDPKVTLDQILCGIYDLALLSAYYEADHSATFVQIGRPFLYFQFDQSCLIFPLDSSYFKTSDRPFPFENYLTKLELNGSSAPCCISSELSNRLYFLKKKKTELDSSLQLPLVYYTLLFQKPSDLLSHSILKALSELSPPESLKRLLSPWIKPLHGVKNTHIEWPLTLTLSLYSSTGIKLYLKQEHSDEDHLCMIDHVFKRSPDVLEKFLNYLNLEPHKVTMLLVAFIKKTDLLSKDLSALSRLSIFYHHLTTKLLDSFLEKFLLLNQALLAYAIYSELKPYVPVQYDRDSITLEKLIDSLLNDPKLHQRPEFSILKIELAQFKIRKTAEKETLICHLELFKNPFFKTVLEETKDLLHVVTNIYILRIYTAPGLKDLSDLREIFYFLPKKTQPFLYLKLLEKGITFREQEDYQEWLIELTKTIFSLDLEKELTLQTLLFPELKSLFTPEYFQDIKNLLENKKSNLTEQDSNLLKLYYHYNIKADFNLNKKFKLKKITSSFSLKKSLSEYFRSLELNYYKPLTPDELTFLLKRFQSYSKADFSAFCNFRLKQFLNRFTPIEKQIFANNFLFSFLDQPAYFLQLLKTAFEVLGPQTRSIKETILDEFKTNPSLENISEYKTLKSALIEDQFEEILSRDSLRELERILEDPAHFLLLSQSPKIQQSLMIFFEDQLREVTFIFDLMLLEKIIAKCNFLHKETFYKKILKRSLALKTNNSFKAWLVHLTKQILSASLEQNPAIQKLLYPEIASLLCSTHFMEMKHLLEAFHAKLYKNPDPATVSLFLQFNIKAEHRLNIKFKLKFASEYELKTSLADYFRGIKLNYFTLLKKEELLQILKFYTESSYEAFEEFCHLRLSNLIEPLSPKDQLNCIKEGLLLYKELPKRFLKLISLFSDIREFYFSDFFKTHLNLEKWPSQNCFEFFNLLSLKDYPYLHSQLPLMAKKISGQRQGSLQVIDWINRSKLVHEEYLNEIIDNLEKTLPEILIPLFCISLSSSSEKSFKKLLPLVLNFSWPCETVNVIFDHFHVAQPILESDSTLCEKFFDKTLAALNQTDVNQKTLLKISNHLNLLNDAQKFLFLEFLIKNSFTQLPDQINKLFVEMFSKSATKNIFKDLTKLLYQKSKDHTGSQQAFQETFLLVFKEWPDLFGDLIANLPKTSLQEETFWQFAEQFKDKISQMNDLEGFIEKLLAFAEIEHLALIQYILKAPLIQKKFAHKLTQYECRLLNTLLTKKTDLKKLLPLLETYKLKKKHLEPVSKLLQLHLDQILDMKASLEIYYAFLQLFIHFKVQPTERAKEFYTSILDPNFIQPISAFLPKYLEFYEKGWLQLNSHFFEFHFNLINLAKNQKQTTHFKDLLAIAKPLILKLPNEEKLLYIKATLTNLEACSSHATIFLLWTLEFNLPTYQEICKTFLDLYAENFKNWESSSVIDLTTALQHHQELYPITHKLLQSLIDQKIDKKTLLDLIETSSYNDFHVLETFFSSFLPEDSLLYEKILNLLPKLEAGFSHYGPLLLKKIDFNNISKQLLLKLLLYPEIFKNTLESISFSFYSKLHENLIGNPLKKHLRNLTHFRKTVQFASTEWSKVDLAFFDLLIKVSCEEKTDFIFEILNLSRKTEENLLKRSSSPSEKYFFIAEILNLPENISDDIYLKRKVAYFLKEDAHTWDTPEILPKTWQLLEDLYEDDPKLIFYLVEHEKFFLRLVERELLVEAGSLMTLGIFNPAPLRILYISQNLLLKIKTFLKEDPWNPLSKEHYEEVLNEFIQLYPSLAKIESQFNHIEKFIKAGLWENIDQVLIHLLFQQPTQLSSKYLYQLLALKLDYFDAFEIDQGPASSYFNLRRKLISSIKYLDAIAEVYLLQLVKTSEKLYPFLENKISFHAFCQILTKYLSIGLLEEKFHPCLHLELFEKVTYLQIVLADVDNAKILEWYKPLFAKMYKFYPNSQLSNERKEPLALALLFKSPLILPDSNPVSQKEGPSFEIVDLFAQIAIHIPIERLVQLTIEKLLLYPTPYSICRAVLIAASFFKNLIEKGEKSWKPIMEKLCPLFLYFPIQHSRFQEIMINWSTFMSHNAWPTNCTQKPIVFEILLYTFKNYFNHHKALEKGLPYLVQLLFQAHCINAIGIERYLKEVENLFDWGLMGTHESADPIAGALMIEDDLTEQRFKLLSKWIEKLVQSDRPRNYRLGIGYYKKLQLPEAPTEEFLKTVEKLEKLKEAQQLVAEIE